MNPVQTEEFFVVGPSVRTNNDLEMHPNTAQIGKLWQNFAVRRSEIPHQAGGTYGVYFDYVTDSTGEYSVLAGEKTSSRGDIPNGMSEVNVPAGKYVVFSGKGPAEETVPSVWMQVWQYFSENSDYERTYTFDYEQYSPDSDGEYCDLELFIGVK